MTHEDLIDIGFKVKGEWEDDPYYRIDFHPPFNFGVTSLSGNLDGDLFDLYGNGKKYANKENLQKIIEIFT